MQTHLSRQIICSVAMVLLSACSTSLVPMPQRFPLYEGPLLSMDEVAIFLPTPSLILKRVDDVDVPSWKLSDFAYGTSGRHIELLPGLHKLEYEYYFRSSYVTVTSASLAVKMVSIEAGHIYEARDIVGTRNQWRVEIVDVTEKERANLVAKRAAASRG